MSTHSRIEFAQDDVRDFHRIGEQAINDAPTIPSASVTALRRRLIAEEVAEVDKALEEGDLVEIADGIADAIYVLLGTAVSYGIDMEPVWNEVQNSNVAKFQPCEACRGLGLVKAAGVAMPDRCATCNGTGRVIVRDDGGKITKPKGWTPPNIATVLAKQMGREVETLTVGALTSDVQDAYGIYSNGIGQWWFYDETWSRRLGPYSSEALARSEQAAYAKTL